MMILKLLLNIKMICKMFTKILKNEIQKTKCKVLIVFDETIVDTINNKKLNPVVTEIFTRCRKLNISIAFTTQSDFKLPKEARRNTADFFIIKIPNKKENHKIAVYH